jgi:hypothetical protein
MKGNKNLLQIGLDKGGHYSCIWYEYGYIYWSFIYSSIILCSYVD